MKRKDYYRILEISRSESAEGIKAAFRRLAKRHHPDVAGPRGTRSFQEIAEAYSVLSDPVSRRKYTDELRRTERGSRSAKFHARSQQSVERESPHATAFSLDELLSRFLKDFQGYGFFGTKEDWWGLAELGLRWAASRRTYAAELVLELSSGEAKKGGVMPAEITVSTPCPECLGSGEIPPYLCQSCSGRGITAKRATLRITIPQRTKSGTILEGRISRPEGDYIVRIEVKVRKSFVRPLPPRPPQPA